VLRASWGKVSVLASCETATDVIDAKSKGYATAVVVDKFASDKAYHVDGIKVIPCPEATGKAANCSECRLCWNDSRLQVMNATIAFEAHGNGANKVKNALIQLRTK
jgi:hypothetical protein